MKRFQLHQRVRITEADHELLGRAGQVVRMRHCDDAAWVAMDEPLPEGWRAFPADDPAGRGCHLLIDPEFCSEEKS